MPAGDLYQCRIQYSFAGAAMENVFHLLQATGTGLAGLLSGTLFTDWVSDMVAVQSTSVTHVQIVVKNLGDPTDFTTRVGADIGERIGDPMPSFVSWGFKFGTTDLRIRSGGCRIGGISEDDVTDGVATAPALGVLATLSATFNATLIDVGATNAWNLVLHTPGNVATLGLPLTVGTVGNNYARVTTQSTRKVF